MNFREYADKQRKNLHKDILQALCMEIKNCADCHNDDTGKTDCNPECRLYQELHKVTANGFYIEPINPKINRKMFEIASQFGYKCGFVMEGNQVSYIKFYK